MCLREAQVFPDSIKPFETLRYIMDPDRQHFKFYNLVDFDDTQFLPTRPLSGEQMEFCSELKEQDFVDALKYDIKGQVIDWSRAQVCKVSERFVNVRFLGDS